MAVRGMLVVLDERQDGEREVVKSASTGFPETRPSCKMHIVRFNTERSPRLLGNGHLFVRRRLELPHVQREQANSFYLLP